MQYRWRGMNRTIIAAGTGTTLLLVLGGCEKKVTVQPPPRVETAADLPKMTSTIAVPIVAPMSQVEAALDQAVPRTLWQINQHKDRCVPAQHVLKGKILGQKIFGDKGLKVTPDMGCQIVGQVVRGPIQLSGKGRTLIATLPVNAVVHVRDVGGVIRQETATGSASVRAVIRLGMRPDWTPTATVDLSYDWTNPPGITLLGQRITFVDKADKRLTKVVADLERKLPQELAKLNLREQLDQAWRSGFTSVMLNERKPPVWMRITPQKVGLLDYRVSGNQILLNVAAETMTETFVGDRPPDPPATPLPPSTKAIPHHGLDFNIPVLADYAQLEPVVLRALKKRAAKGITLPSVGPVEADFQKATVYATSGGRIAVGVDLVAQLPGKPNTRTQAQVWLTGVPHNDVDSRVVSVEGLAMAAGSNSTTVNLAMQLLSDPTVLATIQSALVEDFTKDYNHVLTAAQKAIRNKREGDIIISADITKVVSGKIKVTGQGLFLPVRATGTATITYKPVK